MQQCIENWFSDYLPNRRQAAVLPCDFPMIYYSWTLFFLVNINDIVNDLNSSIHHQFADDTSLHMLIIPYQPQLNPYHAEFHKWNNLSCIFWHSPLSFWGYQDENFQLVSQQYRAWSDCTDVQSGLALYWWQRLITFGVSRIRVNFPVSNSYSFKLG